MRKSYSLLYILITWKLSLNPEPRISWSRFGRRVHHPSKYFPSMRECEMKRNIYFSENGELKEENDIVLILECCGQDN
jgi:hypothetical protein